MRKVGWAVLGVVLFGIPATSQIVQLKLDASEADAAVAILVKESGGILVRSEDWNTLFSTEPYKRLKMREASAGSDFSDDGFKAFLSAPETRTSLVDLKRTLWTWSQTDLTEVGKSVLAYLPQGAQIHAKVYLEIKPAKNSFVWGAGDDRAIFLYLNPSLTKAQFQNKVAHESHHIGLESLESQQAAVLSALSEPQKEAVRWLGVFGEGEAMLAAAGSPDAHPHAADDESARRAWDSDMANFNRDRAAVERFLLDILDAKLKLPNEIDQRAEPFYGSQGAWYTVGYRMASLVEKRFGRPALLAAMLDPRKLLLLYNRTAAKQNLPLWSSELLRKLEAR